RWMGSHEFGIYVYVWTWVMLIGGLLDVGLASAAQRFIPKYTNEGAFENLRGFLLGGRWLTFGIATVIAIVGVFCINLLSHRLDDYTIIPLYLGCIALPICGVMNLQDAISRSYNWAYLALTPQYIVRHVLLVVFLGGAILAGFPADAATTVAVAGLSMWVAAFGQMILLNRRLRQTVVQGPNNYEPRSWLANAAPIKLVESFYLLLTYTDILILNQFRSPDDVAIYYAAGKSLALVAFVYFAVSAAASHKFTEYHVSGAHERLEEFIVATVRWTFWPSLIGIGFVLALGWPLLWMFGPRFVEGYPLIFVLAIGMLARASIGPGERLLNMLGEQKACMMVVMTAFAFNIVACLLLIPRYGAMGAATALSASFVLESILFFIVTKRQIGVHMFIWGLRR
ncbi:MAG: lipopolysaccharide biosynthesis protein, partial [Xanthobacteraceae bacterium]